MCSTRRMVTAVQRGVGKFQDERGQSRALQGCKGGGGRYLTRADKGAP